MLMKLSDTFTSFFLCQTAKGSVDCSFYAFKNKDSWQILILEFVASYLSLVGRMTFYCSWKASAFPNL